MNASIEAAGPRAALQRRMLLAGLAILAAGLGVAFAARLSGASSEVVRSLGLGAVVAWGAALSWLMILRQTFARGNRAFVTGVVGGFAIRLVVFAAVLVFAGLRGNFDLPFLVLSLFGSHLAHQIAEVALLHHGRRTGALGMVALAACLVAAPVAVRASEPPPDPAAATTPAAAEPTLEHAEPTAEAGHAQPEGEHAAEPGHGEAAAGHDAAEAGHGAEGGHGDPHKFDLMHHITNSNELELPFAKVHLPTGWVVAGIDLSPTKHVVWMWIASGTLLVLMFIAMRQVGPVSRGLGNLVEAIVLYIRDELAVKNIATHPERFTPYLCTLFFFILACNLAGLVPWGATATSNLNVTGGLAVLSLLMIQATGIRENGLIKHLKGFCPIPHGLPTWLLPLYVPVIFAVEIVGAFAKPVALALRLFANMVAGHIVILSLIGLIFTMQTVFVAPASVAFALFVYLLELFVALVQAFIFTMLTALFIGMSQHPAH